MKRIAAWVLAASLAIGLLAGCGGAKQADGTGNPTTPQPATETKSEPQVVNLNIGSEPPQMDPGRTTDTTSFSVLNQVLEGIVRQGEGGSIKQGSGQAAKWDVSADGLTYTFTLKDGLKWSDGKPVTAQDFAYSWLRALDPNTASDYSYQLFYIKGGEAFGTLDLKAADFKTKYDEAKKNVGIEAQGDKTIKVTLERPVPYFESLLAFPTYLPVRQDIVEKSGEKFAADADKLVYNGPFVIKSWQHDAEIVLEKNPGYWDAQTVKLETINFKMVVDNNTAVNMFEAGQLDRTGLNAASLPLYKGKPGYSTRADATTWYLLFNLRGNNPAKKYLLNPHIRKAISLAMDRKGFIDNVLKDGSDPALGYVPPSIGIQGQAFRQSGEGFLNANADAAGAQAELAAGLKELGLDKLPELEMMINTGDTTKRWAQGVQGMLQTNLPGVTVSILPLDFKVRLDREDKGQYDLEIAGWGGDYNDPNTFMDMWVTGGGNNKAGYKNPAYDELIKQAAASTDVKVRKDAFSKAEQILMADLPIVPLWHPTVNGVGKPYLKGVLTFTVGAGIDLKYAYVEGKQ